MGWVISIFLNIILGFINFIFTMVIEYIDVCDCLMVGFIVWVSCTYGFDIHSGISFLIALAIVIPLYILFKHRLGFWIVTVPFSLIWSYIFIEWIIKDMFHKSPDTIWYWIIFVGAFLFNIATHLYASHRFDNLENELAAEEAKL